MWKLLSSAANKKDEEAKKVKEAEAAKEVKRAEATTIAAAGWTTMYFYGGEDTRQTMIRTGLHGVSVYTNDFFFFFFFLLAQGYQVRTHIIYVLSGQRKTNSKKKPRICCIILYLAPRLRRTAKVSVIRISSYLELRHHHHHHHHLPQLCPLLNN